MNRRERDEGSREKFFFAKIVEIRFAGERVPIPPMGVEQDSRNHKRRTGEDHFLIHQSIVRIHGGRPPAPILVTRDFVRVQQGRVPVSETVIGPFVVAHCAWILILDPVEPWTVRRVLFPNPPSIFPPEIETIAVVVSKENRFQGVFHHSLSAAFADVPPAERRLSAAGLPVDIDRSDAAAPSPISADARKLPKGPPSNDPQAQRGSRRPLGCLLRNR